MGQKTNDKYTVSTGNIYDFGIYCSFNSNTYYPLEFPGQSLSSSFMRRLDLLAIPYYSSLPNNRWNDKEEVRTNI